MEIFIQAQGQPDLLPLSVEPATTVGTVRHTLAEMMRVSPEAIQLAFAGALLENESTLEAVKVGDGGTLQLGIDRRATGALAGLGASLDEGGVMPLVAMTPHGMDAGKKPVASVLLETTDGQVFEVESRVAFVSPAVCRGFDPTNPEAPVALPNVSANALTGILEYCRFHTAPGRSAKESRAFDKKFAKVDRATMCELASAAYYMEVEPLIDLTCKAIASSIDWSSPEAIRDAFGLPDDLTEEEKLEPIACDADDLRTRQYNNLLARKRKQLADSKSGKPAAEKKEDTRSIEELMSFLGEDTEEGGKKGKKKKNKNKKKKGKGDEELAPGSTDTKPREGDTDTKKSPNKEDAAEFGEAKREELKKKLAEMTPEEMDALFNHDDEEEMDEEAEMELAMFSAKLGLGGE